MPDSISHSITLDTAIAMTTLYRQNRPDNFAICETFRLDEVTKLLATPSAAFLRIYYGMKDDTTVHAILVAADANGNDILPPTGIASNLGDDGDPQILEDSTRCPTVCPPDSPLN